jgi:hypothetical protein
VVFASTVLIYRWRADRRQTLGLGAAFLFLGAWLTCYRFMYYDVLLSIMGVACLFAEPWRLFRSKVFALDFAPQSAIEAPSIAPAAAPPNLPGPKRLGYFNSFPLTVILALFVLDNVLTGLAVEATVGVLGWGSPTTAANGSTMFSSPRIHADTSINYPWDTAWVIALWAWCGWRLLRGDECPGSQINGGSRLEASTD